MNLYMKIMKRERKKLSFIVFANQTGCNKRFNVHFLNAHELANFKSHSENFPHRSYQETGEAE